jgi:aspartate/methionine/tyrosine aminotransferase
MDNPALDAKWRKRVTERCGGENFDAPGSGYSFSAVLAEEEELDKANVPGDPASAQLKLSIADPTEKMDEEAWAAADDYYHSSPHATRYTDNKGIRPLKTERHDFLDTHTAIVDYLKRRFPGPTTAWLTPDCAQYSGHGIKGVLAGYVPTALFDEKTTLIFPNPGYGVIKSPMNCYDADVENLTLLQRGDGRWLISIDQLETIYGRHTEQKLIVYVNVPHNPTGTGYTAADWRRLLDWAYERNAILIVDEAYFDLCYNPDCVSVLTMPDWQESCVVCQSASKGWNATGLRFGWMIGHPTIIAALSKVTDVKDSGLFGPSIAAGLECLAHPEWAAKTREQYRSLHQILADGLRQAGFAAAMPDAGLCQFTPAPKSADGQVFANAAECAIWLRKNLRISVMHYDVAGAPYLRWAVTIMPVPECDLPDEQAVIAEAVRRLQTIKFEG